MKVRLAYTKKNEAKYIAHLDLSRMLDRALRRAQIEVAYSEGFNPHPKISFGPPLPVGVEGEREFVDIDLKIPEGKQEKNLLDEVIVRLQLQMPEGIEILDYGIRPLGSKALTAIINLAVYKISIAFLEPVHFARFQEAYESWLARKEVMSTRLQKGLKIERNIRPFVFKIQAVAGETPTVSAAVFEIKTGNDGSVRPVEVLESLKLLEGLPVDIKGINTTRVGLYIEQPDGERIDPLQVIR